jgi:hypothetical protein
MVAVTAMAVSQSEAKASTIYQSATLGTTGLTVGVVLDADQYLGVRFQVLSGVTTSVIGIHATVYSGSLFGAIVNLTGPTDFPDSVTLTTADVLGSALLTQSPVGAPSKF